MSSHERSRGSTDGWAINWPAIARLVAQPLFTFGLIAMLSVSWLVVIAIGHRRYVALTLAGVLVVICIARAWLDVRRGPSWIRG